MTTHATLQMQYAITPINNEGSQLVFNTGIARIY